MLKIATKQEGKFSNQALTLYKACEANYLENQCNKETNLLTRKNGQSHIIDVIIAHVSSLPNVIDKPSAIHTCKWKGSWKSPPVTNDAPIWERERDWEREFWIRQKLQIGVIPTQ